MALVKGKWTFKDVLAEPTKNYKEEVNFTWWDSQCMTILLGNGNNDYANDFYGLVFVVCDDFGGGYEEAAYCFEEHEDGYEVGWQNGHIETIDFGETEQTVSDEFYAWLVENTVGGTVSETIEINITENGTTTLATAGKYCDRNIDVNVDVPIPELSYASLLDGTMVGDFYDDKVTYLKSCAFMSCKNLTSISLPNCVQAHNTSTFNGCENVVNIHLPKLKTISESASRVFYYMTKVKKIDLPSLETAPNMSYTFELCREVEIINMPNLIGTSLSRTFYNCYKLHTLVLGGDKESNTINTMASTNALTNAGTQTTTGLRIYVPDDMVDAYKTATNWTAYADKIKPMSELNGG